MVKQALLFTGIMILILAVALGVAMGIVALMEAVGTIISLCILVVLIFFVTLGIMWLQENY